MTDALMERIGFAVLASIPPTIAALAAWRQSRRNTKKADEIVKKAEHIEKLTNSNLEMVKAQLAAANVRIQALQNLVSKLAKGET